MKSTSSPSVLSGAASESKSSTTRIRRNQRLGQDHQRAQLLMAINDQEQDDATAAAVSTQRDKVEKLKEKIAELTQQVSAVSQVHETKSANEGA